MSDTVLDAVRAKYPRYADVDDETLTLAVGTKAPVYLKADPKFENRFNLLKQQRALDKEPAGAKVLGALGAAGEAITPSFKTTPAQPPAHPEGELKPLSRWENFKYSAREKLESVFPGMREKGSPDPASVVMGAASIAPLGLPAKIGVPLMAYFNARLAYQQPAIIRQVRDEMKAGDYTAAQHDVIEDALTIGWMGSGLMSMKPAVMVKGQPVTGKPGQTHADIAQTAPIEIKPAAEEAVKDDANRVFVQTDEAGKQTVLTREEAAKLHPEIETTVEDGKLHSEDLLKAQARQPDAALDDVHRRAWAGIEPEAQAEVLANGGEPLTNENMARLIREARGRLVKKDWQGSRTVEKGVEPKATSPQPSPPSDGGEGAAKLPIVLPPGIFSDETADASVAELMRIAAGEEAAANAPVLPGPREQAEVDPAELARQKALREEMRKAQERPPSPQPSPPGEGEAKWSPPRAEPVEPVPAAVGAYTFGDAVKDAGGLSAPPLDEALAAMRKGKAAAKVVAEWAGDKGGEHDELAGILEEIADARDGKERVRYNALRKAYAKAFADDTPGGADKTLEGLRDMQREGQLPQRAPESEGDLYRSQWEHHTAGPAVDAEATAAAQAEADWQAFTESLNQREDGIYSGDQKLGALEGKAFVPTPEAETLPPEYQTAVLARAGAGLNEEGGMKNEEIGFPLQKGFDIQSNLRKLKPYQRAYIEKLKDTYQLESRGLQGEGNLHIAPSEFEGFGAIAARDDHFDSFNENTLPSVSGADLVRGREQFRVDPGTGRLIYPPHSEWRAMSDAMDAEGVAFPHTAGGPLPKDFNPKILRLVTDQAGRVIRQGHIPFPDYARAMHATLAGKFQPYYHAAYNQVREYTEAQAIRNQLTPREEIENYDSTGQFTGGAGSANGGDDAAGVQQKLSGTVGGGSVGRRPGLRVVDEGDLPAPRAVVRSGEYTGPAGAAIDETQRFAANLALTAFEDGKRAFLLGDGTGVGKTGTQLVLAAQTYLRTKLPSLIITANTGLIEGNFKQDGLTKFGIPTTGIEFGTYGDLSDGKFAGKDYGLVIFDEAQYLKNAQSLRATEGAKVQARHKVYATATPMDNPPHAAYFLAELTGRTKQSVADLLGFHYEMLPRRGDGKVVEHAVLNRKKGVLRWDAVTDNLKRMRNEVVRSGQLVRREYPFYGTAAIKNAPAFTSEQRKEQEQIINYWNTRIENAPWYKRRDLAGNKTQELVRWSENQKTPHMLKQIEDDLAAGKRVIVFGKNVNPTRVNGLDGKILPGFLGELGRQLDKRGVAWAKVFGDDAALKGREVRDFQKGQYKVLLATAKSGGTGFDMDDVFGDEPRAAHTTAFDFSAEVMDQMIGRVSRRNTASPAEFSIWHNAESYGDRRTMDVADKKMRVLRNIQSGEDLDTSDFAEGDEVGMQDKQTQSPEFQRWFGDSKVVDKDGKPLFDPSQELYGNVSENSWKQIENAAKETDLIKTESGLYKHQETIDSVLAKIPPQLHTPEVKDEINDLVAKKELQDALPYNCDDIDRANDNDSETREQSKSFARYVVDSEQILKQAGYGNSGSTFHGSWYISAPDGYTISIRDHENTAVGGTSFSDQVLIDNASRFGSVSQGLDDALDKFTQRRYDKWEEKIKSAIGNKGTWSRTDLNIIGMPIEAGDLFSFEPAETDAALAARLQSEESRKQKAEMQQRLQARAQARLTGTSGDLGQGDFVSGGDDLWASQSGGIRGNQGETEHGMNTPPGGMADLPVEMAPGGAAKAGGASLPQIMVALENVSRAAGGQTPIRTGRRMDRNRAIYKEYPEVVRLKGIDDIPAAAHEIGHDLAKQVLQGVSLKAKGSTLKGPQGNAAAVAELEALGRKLYGSRRPVAGYEGEGWAEYLRHWLSTDEAATVAPTMDKWFNQDFLPNNPKVSEALKQARSLITSWRLMGAEARAKSQLVREPGEWRKLLGTLAKLTSRKATVESFAPLERASKRAAEKLGRPLRPSEDPYLLASWKRGGAGATVERMVEKHMIDLYGNPTGPGLREIFAPVHGQRNETMLYIFGKAALARWRQGKNPGISAADAKFIVDKLDTPQRAIAAQQFQTWQRGLLNYLMQADPGTAEVIRRFNVDFYAPLARMIDPARARSAVARAASDPMHRMHGSALPVKDIFDQTIRNANRLVARANRALVTNSLVKLANIEGMGHIIERIPRGRVKHVVNVSAIREQLEDLGAELEGVRDDELLDYWTPAEMPKGADPIISVGSGRQKAWFQVDPELYDTLDGLQAYSLKNAFPALPGLGTALDLLMGAPSRMFRLGTTGLRGSFGLVTRPLRNLPVMLLQSNAKNPALAAAMWPAETAKILRAAMTGKESGYAQAFRDLSGEGGQALGLDMGYTKRVSDGLFYGRFLTSVKHPLDMLRQVFHLPDTGLRTAALAAKAREIGWVPGTPLSPDQAVTLGLEAKRALVDFSASGDVSRIMNQAIPFYNPIIQHVRSFARAFQEHPVRTSLLGLGLLTAPTLLNWWRNKDKEWYGALPWREKYMFSYVDDGKNLWRISRPYEYGEAFMVMPEALMDSWYKQDPEAVKQAFSSVFHESNPLDWPTSIKGLKEQWQNRIDFWDRPIVPEREQNLPPGQQAGPYTTKLAQTIGKVFPNVSPRRVDAAIDAYFGGASQDALRLLGLGPQSSGREKELSDVPVLGTLWRRGGEFNAQNQHVADFYDDLTRLDQRVNGANFATRSPLPPGLRLKLPQTPDGVRLELARKAADNIRLILWTADRTKDNAAREQLYKAAGEEAEAGRKMLAPAFTPEQEKAAQVRALMQPQTNASQKPTPPATNRFSAFTP